MPDVASQAERPTVLELAADAYEQMIAHAFEGVPNEACGLLGGRPGEAAIDVFVPCRNADGSSRTYSIGPDGWQAADEALQGTDLEVVGVMHSHTHTEAYPSPTDVAKADNPLLVGWHYVIVSLKRDEPVLRSWRIDGTEVTEEPVALVER